MDYTPVTGNKHLGVHTNLLLLANPALVNSISAKLASSEGKKFPQVGIYGGIWKTFALDLLAGDFMSTADLYGYSVGFFVAKRVDPSTRLFTHISYSRITLNLVLAEELDLGIMKFQTLSAGAFDTYIFTGIEYTAGEYKDKVIIAQTGYGIRSNKIVAKILIQKGAIEYGLSIYPEGLLVIHPVLNIQFRF